VYDKRSVSNVDHSLRFSEKISSFSIRSLQQEACTSSDDILKRSALVFYHWCTTTIFLDEPALDGSVDMDCLQNIWSTSCS
jgi:hypothetical protein